MYIVGTEMYISDFSKKILRMIKKYYELCLASFNPPHLYG